MFLWHCLQNPADSDKSSQILSWIHLPQNSINVFHHTWVMCLHYLVKHSVVDKAVNQWHPRLGMHICDKGQHFGHLPNYIFAFSCWILNLQISFFGDCNFCHKFRRKFDYFCETQLKRLRRLSNGAC